MPKKKHFEVTDSQRSFIINLRKILAEKEYRLFDVSPRFSHSSSDFFAVPTVTIPNSGAVMFRIEQNGKIEVRPYSASAFQVCIRKIQESAGDISCIFEGKTLPSVEQREGFAVFVPKSQRSLLA